LGFDERIYSGGGEREGKGSRFYMFPEVRGVTAQEEGEP